MRTVLFHLAALASLGAYTAALVVLLFLDGLSFGRASLLPIPFVLVLQFLARRIRVGWYVFWGSAATALCVAGRLWIDLWLHVV